MQSVPYFLFFFIVSKKRFFEKMILSLAFNNRLILPEAEFLLQPKLKNCINTYSMECTIIRTTLMQST